MHHVRPELAQRVPQRGRRERIGGLQHAPQRGLAAEAREVRVVLERERPRRAREQLRLVATAPQPVAQGEGYALGAAAQDAVIVDEQDPHRGPAAGAPSAPCVSA